MAEAPKPAVVVVEDDPETLAFLLHVFADYGITAAACAPGVDAAACIRALRPKVVVLDVTLGLPDVDAFTIYQQLRADPAGQAIGVVFFTAAIEELRKRLPGGSADRTYIVLKPDTDVLLSKVRQLFAEG